MIYVGYNYYFLFKHGKVSVTVDEFETNRNKRAFIRDFIALFVNNISISDTSSIGLQSSMLARLTQESDELTREMGVEFNKKI